MDKFKAYQQQMEKALRAFENTTEWADLVNALGKVNKVLFNYPQFSKIPCDAILGRRLAQCLNPDLPNGVQFKALETYDLLFKAIGTDNLMQELSKFSNGLFPLLSHADLNVKPKLLELYETHFLPLNERLRPALDGFLIATLPGLEENTDFYNRTDTLLMEVCAGVQPDIFYSSLWRCIIIDPSVRLNAMNFLISHFNKKRSLESQLYILGTSTETLITAICVSLLDIRNVLVQRAALDLLLCCFPLHNQQIKPESMITIVTGAVTVLLRRDISLSRRLLAWIFNKESAGKKSESLAAIYGTQTQASGTQTNLSTTTLNSNITSKTTSSREQREQERKICYFDTYVKSYIIEAFKNCLSGPSKVLDIPNCWSNLGEYWNYRLLICLIDYPEICELIIDDLCLDILRSLCRNFRQQGNQRPEFIRTIRLLLNSMNISYIWSRICSLIVKVCEERRFNKKNSYQKPDANLNAECVSSESQTALVSSEDDVSCLSFSVKPVGSERTDIIELCSAYDFVMECFPIESYDETTRDFFPKILFNLLTLVTDYCAILEKKEFLVLIKVISNVFEGLNVIYKQSESLKMSDLANRLVQPSPDLKGKISLVPEDDEEVDDTPTDQQANTTNDSSNSNIENNNPITTATTTTTITASLDDKHQPQQLPTNNEHNPTSIYLPLDIGSYDKIETPSLEALIEQYQRFFHNFVITRLVKCDLVSLRKVMLEYFAEISENQYLNSKKIEQQQQQQQLQQHHHHHQSAFDNRANIKQYEFQLSINNDLEVVFQALCQLLSAISRISVFDEDDDSVDIESNSNSKLFLDRRYSNNSNFVAKKNYIQENTAIVGDKLRTQSTDQQHQQHQSTSSSSSFQASIIGNEQSVNQDSFERQFYQDLENFMCAPYVLDLMILSKMASNIRVSYSSLNLILELLTVARLNYDIEFSIANKPVEDATLTFSEEINASVIGHRNSQEESKKRLMLNYDEYKFITIESCWYHQVMFRLWQTLGSKQSVWTETVCLIQDIHNLTYKSHVCEDIICNSLNSPDEQVAYEARKRFHLLFSLMKTGRSSLNLKHKEFERPLFFMLDSLSHKMEAFNCLSRDWLTQVFKFRATPRVLGPVLEILLHPDTARIAITQTKVDLSAVYHSHILLYPQVYDSQRILYALSTLWNIINTEPHQGLVRMANSSMKHCHELQELHVRHLNSLAGRNFHGEIAIDHRANFPTFLELILSTCLNFICGYYMPLPSFKLTQADIQGNQKVRILASEILRSILNNLYEAVKGYPTQSIHDLLDRCRTQQLVLQCLATSVKLSHRPNDNNHHHYSAQSDINTIRDSSVEQERFSMPSIDLSILTSKLESLNTINSNTSDEIIFLNDESTAYHANNLHNANQSNMQDNNLQIDTQTSYNTFQDDFQRTLLRLSEELMMLEFKVAPPNMLIDNDTSNNRRDSDSKSARIRYQPDLSSGSLKYYPNILISSQPLFFASIKTALSQIHRCDLHLNWLALIERSLEISGRSLTRLEVCVVTLICSTLKQISNCIIENQNPNSINLQITSKYLSSLMASLTHLTHYCLIDGTTNQSSSNMYTNAGGLTQKSESLSTLQSTSSGLGNTHNTDSTNFLQSGNSMGSTATLISAGTSGPVSLGQVGHNLFSNFLSNVFTTEPQLSLSSFTNSKQTDPMVAARKALISRLSDIIDSLLLVWKAMVHLDSRNDELSKSWAILGESSDIKKQILTFLSPISLKHGISFMNSISVVWRDLRSKTPPPNVQPLRSRREIIPPSNADQLMLVDIVAAISELPMEAVFQTTRLVIHNNPQRNDNRDRRRVPLEVGLLQFFLAYIRLFPGSQLIECWKSLLHLLREGLQLGPPAMPLAQFQILAILHEIVQTVPLIEDRKDQKDLQEVTQRLIDSFTTVIKARLGQTRWLRGGLEVEPGPQHEPSDDDFEINLSMKHHMPNSNGPQSLNIDRNNGLHSETCSVYGGESKLNENYADNESVATFSSVKTTDNLSIAATLDLASSTAQTSSSQSTSTDENLHLARYSVQALNALAEFVAPVLDVVYPSDEKEKIVPLIANIMYYVIPYLKNHHKHNAPSFQACSHLLSSISGYQYTRKAWRKEALELLLDSQFFQMDMQCMVHWRLIVDHLMMHDFREFLSRMSLNQSGGVSKLFGSRDQESEQRAALIKRMAFVLFCSERDQYQKFIPEIQEKLIESLRLNQSDIVQAQIMLCFRVLIIRSSAQLLTSLWPYVYTEMFQGLLEIEAYIEQFNEKSPSKLEDNPANSSRFLFFLYTCKLLDTILALPADSLPQFQMYRWSFVGGGEGFEPHLVRIARKLNEFESNPKMLTWRRHYPVLTTNKINNLLDLYPFFYTMTRINEFQSSETNKNSSEPDDPQGYIDSIMENDFLET